MRALQIHKDGVHLATVSHEGLDELSVTILATPDSAEPRPTTPPTPSTPLPH